MNDPRPSAARPGEGTADETQQGIGRLGGQALGLGFEAALAATAGTAAALGDMLTATATGGSGLIDIVP